MLSRLGLDLSSRTDDRQPGHVYEQAVFTPNFIPQLTKGFKKRLRLNITNRSADFKDHDLSAGFFCRQPDATFDLIGNVRNHLDGPAEIIATAFFGNGFSIDLPGREITDPAQADVNETFVVTKIKVRFCAVIEHIHLAMLIR